MMSGCVESLMRLLQNSQFKSITRYFKHKCLKVVIKKGKRKDKTSSVAVLKPGQKILHLNFNDNIIYQSPYHTNTNFEIKQNLNTTSKRALEQSN